MKHQGDDPNKDQVIAAIGQIGPWQWKHISLLAASTIFSAVPSLIIKFMAAPNDFVCADVISQQELGSPIALAKQVSQLKNASYGPDECHVWNATDPLNNKNDDNKSVPCTEFAYDNSEWKVTIINQYDLVCGRAHLKDLAQSVFFAGMMVGIFLLGFCADRFGRKATLVPSLVLMALIGTILPFMPTIEAFIALRFFHGLFKIGVFTICFVWCMEAVGGDWKTYIGMGLEFPWVASWLLLSLLAYIFRDWQMLSWISSVLAFACIAFIWILPESPKWLHTAGKLDKAEDLIREAAERNGRPLPSDWKLEPVRDEEDGKKEKKGNVLDLFKSKHMALKTLILYLNWFTNSFVYYGLTLNTGSLGGSFLLNFVINGLLEIPAYAIGLFVILKAGRKLPFVLMMALSGISLLTTLAVPTEGWPIITLAMIGKLCITGSFAIVYVFSAETYPTSLRSVGIGSSSVFARFGGMVAPYVGSLDKSLGPSVPIAIFGLTALIAAIAALMLPETATRKLPDTVKEAANVKVSFKDGIVNIGSKGG